MHQQIIFFSTYIFLGRKNRFGGLLKQSGKWVDQYRSEPEKWFEAKTRLEKAES